VSNLAARSDRQLVVVQFGRYQTAFRKNQLVSWRVLK